MSYKILSIDPATTCGWAVSNDLYGTWNLKTHKDETWGMKLIKLESLLKKIYEVYQFNIVGYERPGGRHTIAIMTQSKIIGIIEKFCEERKIEYKGYSSMEIKKYATGKGNANKEMMLKAAIDKLGYDGDSYDEVDALFLYNYMHTELMIDDIVK